jgi:hypothetical protein
VLTYTAIALLMSLVLELDGTRQIRDKIREGTIATDLMKPISLPLYFFSDGVGMTLLHALLIVPALLVSLFIVHIDVPPPHRAGRLRAELPARLPGELLAELLDELRRVLDARDVRRAADGALDERSDRRSSRAAHLLPGRPCRRSCSRCRSPRSTRRRC